MNRQQHGTTVVNYRLKLEELKSSFAKLNAQRAREEKKAAKVQAELVACKSKASKQEALIKSLRRQNEGLTNSNHDHVSRLEGATERIRKLEAKLVCNYQGAHQARKQPDLQRKVEQYAEALEQEREKLATYEATIEATVEEIDVLSRALNLKVKEYHRANPEETVQSTLLFEFARAQKDLQNMEEQLREKTDQVDKLIGELQETQQTASRLRTINDTLQRSLSQQQNKISEDSMHLTELREKKELVVAERQLLLDQIEATSRERDHFRNLSDSLTKQLNDIERTSALRIDEAQSQTMEAVKQKQAAKDEVFRLHKALEQNTHALAQAHDGAGQLADEVQRLSLKCTRVEEELRLVRDVGRSHSELNTGLQKQLQNAERKIRELQSEISAQANKMSALGEAHGKAQQQRMAYMHAYEDQQAQLLRKTKEDIAMQTELMRARLAQSQQPMETLHREDATAAENGEAGVKGTYHHHAEQKNHRQQPSAAELRQQVRENVEAQQRAMHETQKEKMKAVSPLDAAEENQSQPDWSGLTRERLDDGRPETDSKAEISARSADSAASGESSVIQRLNEVLRTLESNQHLLNSIRTPVGSVQSSPVVSKHLSTSSQTPQRDHSVKARSKADLAAVGTSSLSLEELHY